MKVLPPPQVYILEGPVSSQALSIAEMNHGTGITVLEGASAPCPLEGSRELLESPPWFAQRALHRPGA